MPAMNSAQRSRWFVLFVTLGSAFAASAAADPVLVEFRSPDGVPLVAAGDAPTAWGDRGSQAARKRVEARAAAIAEARTALLASLPADLAAKVRQGYRHFPLVRMNVDAVERSKLLGHPLVVAVYEDFVRRPLMQSALSYIGAEHWQGAGYDGAGTAVAVLDTGIQYWNGFFGDCPDAGIDPAGVEGCRVKVFQGFATLVFGSGTTDPVQVANAEAHGTNVGGIVGDMAPGTSLLSLTVFALYDASSEIGGGTAASDGDVVSALDWVIENRETYNIVSANMSLGSAPDPAARGYCTGYAAGSYQTVFANTRDAGVLPVTATGNEYIKTAVGSPACIASAVRVGAGYDDPAFGMSCGTGPVVPGAVTCFSDSNALVDFIAPGNDIDAAGLYGYSGTSMASPMVAGLAAVYQARYGSDAVWTMERMRVDAVPVPEDFPEQPYVHRYIRMGDHDAVLRFDTGKVFASSYIGLGIPNAAPAGLEVTADVICESEECASDTVGQVYVDLNVEHWKTSELAIELEAPDGTVARHEIVDDTELGTYNINSILGSQHLPGIFDALKGAPIVGTWRLRLIDDGGAETGQLHQAVLLIDSARVQLQTETVAPAIARPSEPFAVAVSVANRGNLDVTAAPLLVELVARADGVVADSVPLELLLPLAPGAAWAGEVELVGVEQGEYDVRVSTTGLAPDLPPGLVGEASPVSITERTFASFGVDPAMPQPGAGAQLVDWSVGLIDTWSWDFGDGTTSTEANPAHVWAEDGEYEVRLTVTGPDGTSTAARLVTVRLVLETQVLAGSSGCACRAAGASGGSGTALGGIAGLLAVLVLRRRARRGAVGRARRAPSFAAPLLACMSLAGCDDHDTGPHDGGEIPGPLAGPWVSLLGPADPSEGDLDLFLRVAHEQSLPCDLTVEYRVGEGAWSPATIEDPARLAGIATAPEAGTELDLRWLATTDLPGDAEAVQLRVTASDGTLDSLPVVTAPFVLLNFFITHPHAVLITEVSTAETNVPGRNRDDYIELYNRTDEELSLEGWKLVVSSASGARDEFLLSRTELGYDVAIPAGGRKTLVEDGAEYAGGWPLPRELAWNNEAYGAVALVGTYERGVDFVRWGGSPERPPRGVDWTEESPLPVPQTLTVLNRADEETDTDAAGDFCVARPTPDEPSGGCLPHLPRGSVLVTELDAAGTDDQIEVLNRSGGPVDLAGWVLLWDGDALGSGTIPLASYELADGARLGLRDNGIAGRVVAGIMTTGSNMNIDGLVPTAVGFKDPYGNVIDFLAAGGSTIRWLDWTEDHPTPMPGPTTTLSRRPGDPDTDNAADFCLTEPNMTTAPVACLEPLGIRLVISEVMMGRPDWIEIYNPGPDPVDLSQVYLSYSAINYGGSVEDFQLSGTLAPGEVLVAADREMTDYTGEFLLPGNIQLSSNSDGSVALRDINGFGIDFLMCGEPPGTPLWPDVWTGLGADKYPTSENYKSIQRTAWDATDTNTRDDWCWAAPSPGVPNLACE
jgi:PKD repeat protein/subtilisin-like proprotein convertase family protein